MFTQIEITTRGNYSCFYCAGRDMEQRDVDWSLFEDILGRLEGQGYRVSLQGEGEPTLHPRFWNMVAAIQAKALVPYTITNGSRIDAERIAANFRHIGISIDTLDAEEAERIGRVGLEKVLRNLDDLLALMESNRIIIHKA